MNIPSLPLRVLVTAAAALGLGACESTPAVTASDAGSDVRLDAPAIDVPPQDVPPPDVMRVRPPAIERTMTDDALATQRTACMFGPGAWPGATLGRDVPVGSDIPIEHVLVLVQENRSFDHYFAHLRDAMNMDVEAPPADWSNPNAMGMPVRPYHDTEYCINDVDHEWEGVHRQYNNGMMNGFVTTNDPNGQRAMGYMDQTDIPFYYSLASTFAFADHYHCAVLGPTWPNRFYLMAATSFGNVGNEFVAQDTRAHPVTTLFSRLDDAGVEWKNYADGPRMIGFFPYYGIQRSETREHMHSIADLMADLRSGSLPGFAFIEPNYIGNGGDRVDEHPPGMPQMGEQFVEGIVRALMASPAWRSTALFITYDEHGGFADHVPPPPACEPDTNMPTLAGRSVEGRFDRLGVRVPFFVVSPYARRHFVSHRTYDHTSIVRFVEARFGLPAMTRRDANAAPPMDMFDFASPPFMTPPTITATSHPPADARARCRMRFSSATGL